MKILINTISTKKHAGGAFQISQNFMLKTLEHSDIEWYYITSQDVDDAIGYKFAHLRGTRYFVFPTQPLKNDGISCVRYSYDRLYVGGYPGRI